MELDVILDSDHILNDGSSPSNNLRVQKEFEIHYDIAYDIAYDINVIHKPENDLVLIVYIFLLT